MPMEEWIRAIVLFQGNFVDLLVILLFLFYLWEGWHRGFLFGFLDLTGFITSFLFALSTYRGIGQLFVTYFSLPKGIAQACGFLLAGFFFEFLFALLNNIFYMRVYKKWMQGVSSTRKLHTFFLLDRFLGFVPVIGESLVVAAFFLTIVIALPVQGVIKKEVVQSHVGSFLLAHTQGIERELHGVFGEAVQETLTFLTVNPNPSSGEAIDLHFTQGETTIDVEAEEAMIALINKERTARGFAQVRVSSELTALARTYAKDMFRRGYFSHNNPEGESPFDRMEKEGIQFGAAGENLALAPNVTLAHQGLMNSAGHRANILSPDFHTVGVGVADGGIYGQMFVQEFTD